MKECWAHMMQAVAHTVAKGPRVQDGSATKLVARRIPSTWLETSGISAADKTNPSGAVQRRLWTILPRSSRCDVHTLELEQTDAVQCTEHLLFRHSRRGCQPLTLHTSVTVVFSWLRWLQSHTHIKQYKNKSNYILDASSLS